MCNAWNHSPMCNCGWGTGYSPVGFYVAPAVSEWWLRLSSFEKESVLRGLDSGENIEQKDPRGYTPLIWAVIQGKYEVAKILISRGANVDAVDNFGQAALYFAAVLRHVALMDLLLANCANSIQLALAEPVLARIVSQESEPSNVRQVRSAWEKGEDSLSLTVVTEALKSGLAVDIRDDRGRTPLIRASIAGNEPLASLLLNFGAAVNWMDSCHQSAVFYACINKHPRVTNLLESYGADPSQRELAQTFLNRLCI